MTIIATKANTMATVGRLASIRLSFVADASRACRSHQQRLSEVKDDSPKDRSPSPRIPVTPRRQPSTLRKASLRRIRSSSNWNRSQPR